jgi:hypothetical protein
VAVVQYTFTHKQYTERPKKKQTIHRKTQTKQYLEQHKNVITTQKNVMERCGPCPVLASYTLAFALQLRKKQGKPSVCKAILKVIKFDHYVMKFSLLPPPELRGR